MFLPPFENKAATRATMLIRVSPTGAQTSSVVSQYCLQCQNVTFVMLVGWFQKQNQDYPKNYRSDFSETWVEDGSDPGMISHFL